MAETIRIDIAKGVEQGQTSVSPASPRTSTAASPSISPKGAAMIGYGALVAKQSINIATNEIKAGGNEQLANTINNITTGVAIGTAIYATGGLAAIPLGIQAAGSIIERQLRVNRENRHKAYERQMMGSRQTYNMGGGYE
jgi:hypothetical protein